MASNPTRHHQRHHKNIDDEEYAKIGFHDITSDSQWKDGENPEARRSSGDMDGFVSIRKTNGGESGFDDNEDTVRRRRSKQFDGHVCQCFHGNGKWVEFTEATTLHGLRHIWLRDSCLLRRLIWLTLTLFCSGVMMFQILDRVIYYYSWPVTVNVRINYNESLNFPAVTMCNQNAFRASRADAIGRYSLITNMFDDVVTFGPRDLEKYSAENDTFSQLYSLAGHRKEDLIVGCYWQGQPCGPENFTEMATDSGLCYSFNIDVHKQLTVSSPGADDGLSLMLNVEQYEYMPGPNDAAGLKILLHHPFQFPNVRGLGLVIPAGGHAFIGTKLLSVTNLPRPHGQCSSKPLRHFSHYSAETCRVECETQFVYELCGCRLYYMPGEKDGVEACTLYQYFECYVPNKHHIRELSSQRCPCPVPCDFLVYDASISYTNTSPLVSERFLAAANSTELKKRYDAARDVTHRRQRDRRLTLLKLIDALGFNFDIVKRLIAKQIEEKVAQQRTALESATNDAKKVYSKTLHLFKYQHYIVDKDFFRARDAMNERTFSVVAMAMQEFVFHVTTSIEQLANQSIEDVAVRTAVHLDVVRTLEARKDIAIRALQNYTQFYEALKNGEPIFNYRYLREPRENTPWIVPVPLLNKGMNYSRTIRRRTVFFKENLLNIVKRLEKFRAIAESTFYNRTLNATDLHLTSVMFLKNCREYLQSRDMFLNDVPDWITAKLQKREDKLVDIWRRFSAARDNLDIQVSALLERLGQVRSGPVNAISGGLDMARQFLRYGNLSKKAVARQFLQEDVQQAQSSLKNFFTEVRSRGQAVYDDWLELEKNANALWKLALDDINLHNYYNQSNMAEMLVDSSSKTENISAEYTDYRENLDLRSTVANVDSDFTAALASLLKEMQKFRDTEEIDGNFMAENILKVNIFYRELSYEQIMQQQAYDMFALLCDIGGSMGLFLGASVLTIFELLDLVAFTYTWTSQKRNK